jgi:hypothetical protein
MMMVMQTCQRGVVTASSLQRRVLHMWAPRAPLSRDAPVVTTGLQGVSSVLLIREDDSSQTGMAYRTHIPVICLSSPCHLPVISLGTPR